MKTFLVALAMAFASPALAASIVDVDNLRTGSASQGYSAGTPYPGGIMQTWTAGITGKLARVDLVTHAYTNAGVLNPALRAVFDIYDAGEFGLSTSDISAASLLKSVTMPLNAVLNGNASASIQTIDLSSLNIVARRGQRLAFRMRATCPGCSDEAYWVNWTVLNDGRVSSHGYNGGKFYQWLGGSSYGSNDPANTDLNFRTWVDASAVVPEPASWMLLIGGFGLIGMIGRRRRRALSPA